MSDGGLNARAYYYNVGASIWKKSVAYSNKDLLTCKFKLKGSTAQKVDNTDIRKSLLDILTKNLATKDTVTLMKMCIDSGLVE